MTRIGRIGAFLWSGWAGLAAMSLLFAAWQAGYEAYGSFILTSPLETMQAVALWSAWRRATLPQRSGW